MKNNKVKLVSFERGDTGSADMDTWSAEGYLEEAKGCLKTAFTLNEKLRLKALDVPDLEPLWRNIGKL